LTAGYRPNRQRWLAAGAKLASSKSWKLPKFADWFGSYLDEDGIVADVLNRVKADAVAIKRWLDPESWKMPNYIRRTRSEIPEHAGCLMFAGMSIRNFYGLWHADNPHTVFDVEDGVQIEDGIITDPRHPDNMSGRIIDRVKAELKKLAAQMSPHEPEMATRTPDGMGITIDEHSAQVGRLF